MLNSGGKEITGVYIGKRALSAIYVGIRMVWSAISSCFGSGFWRSDKPWSGTDGWRRNK